MHNQFWLTPKRPTSGSGKIKASVAGRLRVFATIDLGQSIVTRLLSNFLQKNPKVTAELALSNRPLHIIQEGCDVGIVPGKIIDKSVVARPAGRITLQLVASPSLVDKRPVAKKPADLKSWPWIGVAGCQFWRSNAIRLFADNRVEQTLRISPVLISKNVTSILEAVRAGLGASMLPEFLAREDLRSGRLVHILPRWKPKSLPLHVVYDAGRLLPMRVRAFIDFALSFLGKELGADFCD